MKKCRLVYCLALITLLLAACANSDQGFALDKIRREDGSYGYPGLAWGMTQQEVEAVVGYPLGEVASESSYAGDDGNSHSNETFMPDTHDVYNDNVGTIAFQFIDEKLIDVTVRFVKNDTSEMQNNEPDKLYAKCIDEVKTLFDAPSQEREKDAIELMGRKTLISSCDWEGAGDTLLGVSLIEDGEGKPQSTVVRLAYTGIPKSAG